MLLVTVMQTFNAKKVDQWMPHVAAIFNAYYGAALRTRKEG